MTFCPLSVCLPGWVKPHLQRSIPQGIDKLAEPDSTAPGGMQSCRSSTAAVDVFQGDAEVRPAGDREARRSASRKRHNKNRATLRFNAFQSAPLMKAA